MPLRHIAALLVAASSASFVQADGPIEAVTFASYPGNVYVPVRDTANNLGWRFEYDELTDLTTVNGKPLSVEAPTLFDGTHLVALQTVAEWGGRVDWSGPDRATVSAGARTFQVHLGAKRVLVDMGAQVLRAWQGDRLVFEAPVSTGRLGKETPNGNFRTLAKDPDHVSSIYDSPMPWSVQIVGNIYVHGSESFYDNVGSHGCIRLPLTHGNLAKRFYDWVDLGTPVKVVGSRPRRRDDSAKS